MKKIILMLILSVAIATTYAQTWQKIKGLPEKFTLVNDSLLARPTKTQADNTYAKVSNAIDPLVTFYTKTQIDSIAAYVPRIVLNDNTKHTQTGNTNKVEIFSGPIPANSIGIDGYYEIIIFLSSTSSTANARTLFLNINGTDIYSYGFTSIRSAQYRWFIFNKHSLSSQIMMPASSLSTINWGLSSTAPQTFTFNTAADMTLKLYIQLAVGTEDLSVENIIVIAHPK